MKNYEKYDLLWFLLFFALLVFGCYYIDRNLVKEGDYSSSTGVVTEVSDVWTMNGDGYIKINSGKNIQIVNIVGSPNENSTVIDLKTAKYIQDTIGKKVQVLYPIKNKEIKAILLKEIR